LTPTAPPAIYTLSLHDALPISPVDQVDLPDLRGVEADEPDAELGHDVERDGQADVQREERPRSEHHLDVEDLAFDDASLPVQVEDLEQHGPQRRDQARRDPHEDDGADAEQAGALVDHIQQDLPDGELELRADRRQALEDVLHERLRGVGGLTQDGPADADDREDERDEGDQHVERDRAGHEEDAVVAGLLDDAAGELRRGGEGGKD